jgi:hypothetical protein
VKRWLKNIKAAELLCVEVRTIKRWMTNPAKREALGAIRYGKQWRIPSPQGGGGADEWAWETRARDHLKELGIHLKEQWQNELEVLLKRCERNGLESYRLLLAAHLNLSAKREAVTAEALTEIVLLWQTASEILEKLPEGAHFEKLKSQFPARLKGRRFSASRIRSIMSYWPEKTYIQRVHPIDIKHELEKIWRSLDYSQAVMTCKNLNETPTTKNLRPKVHKDLMRHLNDTRDALPQGTVKAHRAEDLCRVMKADIHNQLHCGAERRIKEGIDEQGKTFALIQEDKSGQEISTFVDLRQPQDGLARRTMQKRHPQKKNPQRAIVVEIEQINANAPSVEERSHTGKTPVRVPKF